MTQGNTAGLFRGALLGQVVTVVSYSISWGAFCNKDDQREVPKPVCRTNVPPAPGHASLGQEETEMVRGMGGLPAPLQSHASWRAQTAPSVGTTVNGGVIGHIQ